MRKLFSILGVVLLYVTVAFGQFAEIDIPITVSDDGTVQPAVRFLKIGLDQTATDGIDVALDEGILPPFPPAGAYESRWDLTPYGSAGIGTYKDYRNAPAYPFSGNVQHKLIWQLGTGATALTIEYELPDGAEMQIIDELGGIVFNSGTLTGTGTYVITSPLTAARFNMTYTNIAPAVSGPTFGIAPASLNFGPVAVGGSSTLQATVSNSGTAPLEITDITSSDPQFTFTAAVLPIILAVGENTVVDVTFSPTAVGAQSGSLVFTHDAPGSPTSYSVSGVGADAGPTFGIDPTSLNFGNVGVGVTEDLVLTVTNNGAVNPLEITSVLSSVPEFTVSPASATIAPLANQVFTVSFTPSAGGTFSGNITFEHNAPSSPDVVPVEGSGIATFGLVFAEDTLYLQEDSVYTETMQLKSLTATATAIQFRLLVNKASDDETVLTFIDMEKGTDVAGDNWALQYNVFRGPLTSNGASVDSIYVLLYDLTQVGLAAGDYNDLFRVKFRVADLPALTDSVKSSIKIAEAEASTFQGFPIDITPSLDELTIFVENRVATYGDVNGDGQIDILDLIMVVDHIIGRDSLEGDFFSRADIAPWTPGASAPNPDGFVNVQDLAVIQNIILTGFFPSGVQVNTPVIAGNESGDQLNKFTSGTAKVKLYITEEGIEFHLNSEVGIRGAQLEFGRVDGNATGMQIDSKLGGGFYLQTNDLLRALLYDVLGQAVIPAGENYVANLPFDNENPQNITLDKIILVNTSRQKIGSIFVEIVYSPSIPLEYALFQNYPNPFNPTTTVEFQVPKTADVTLKIYNTLGQEVRTLFSGQLDGGKYNAQWDGLNNSGVQMSSGTYIYRMISGEFVQSKKMILLK